MPKDLKHTEASFFADLDKFVVLTSRSDAYTSRSGNFCGDDRRQTTDRQSQLLYPLRMRTG